MPFLYSSEIFPQILRGKPRHPVKPSLAKEDCVTTEKLQKLEWLGRRRSLGWEQEYWTYVYQHLLGNLPRQVCCASLRESAPEELYLFLLLSLCRGTDALALCLVWLFVPGTERQQATMEEMNYVFGVATHRHMNYQTKEVAPWCYKHYILRRKGALDPLYRWDRQREDIDGTSNGPLQNGRINQNGSTSIRGRSGTT